MVFSPARGTTGNKHLPLRILHIVPTGCIVSTPSNDHKLSKTTPVFFILHPFATKNCELKLSWKSFDNIFRLKIFENSDELDRQICAENEGTYFDAVQRSLVHSLPRKKYVWRQDQESVRPGVMWTIDSARLEKNRDASLKKRLDRVAMWEEICTKDF